MKKLVISMLLTGLVLCCLAAAEPAPKIGSEAPGLELTDLEGKTFRLQSFIGEKKVILAFLASWSKSCQAEFIDLQPLYTENSKSLEVLAVSFDKKQKDLKAFLAKNEVTYPVLFDKKLSTLDRFQILIIPTTFCINREGVIEKIFVDYDENVKKALVEWIHS
jgi:peroxiredoxin